MPEEAADDITFEDVDAAVAELALARGEDYATTYAQVRSLAGGERDLVSLAAGIIELATGTGSSADTGDHARDLMRRHPEYFGGKGEEEEDEEEGRKKKSSRKRRKAPEQATSQRQRSPETGGWAGPAEVGPRGGQVEAAARQRWARAGVVSLSEDDDDVELELATDDGEGGSLEDIMREHPEYFGAGDGGLQRPSERRERPGRASFRPGPVSTATRAHSGDTDPTVRSHPSRGGAPHPEVERYMDMLHSNGFGGRETPHGSVVTHRRRAG